MSIMAETMNSVADVKLLVWAYKYTREVARRMPSFRGEPSPVHPKFPDGSKASTIEQGTPFAADHPRLEYTAEDDKAIEQHIRESGVS